MKGILEVIVIAVLAGVILTTYDGAVVGEYRWQSLKLFVYSVSSGALLFLVPYVLFVTVAFLARLFVKAKWTAFRTHRFALVASVVIASLLLWGGYYGSTHNGPNRVELETRSP